MVLYKCKDCTHEEHYQYKPSECFVCGGSRLIVIEKGKDGMIVVNKDKSITRPAIVRPLAKSQLDERRANCRIWMHIILWWFIPFGWIVSVRNMRYGIPAYIMLGAICLSIVTAPSPKGLSAEEHFFETFSNGQKYGLVGCVIGSAITIKEILKSRRKIKL